MSVTRPGSRMHRLAAGLVVALLALAVPVVAQDTSAGGGAPPVASGGSPSGSTASGSGAPQPSAGPAQGTIKVHADSSGTLIPEKQRPPQSASDAVQSGGVAAGGLGPQAGGRPASGGAATAGGGSSGALDYAGWERMAVRAENAIIDRNSANTELDHMRSQLVDWREALLGAQNANSARIATLREQIDALGPQPASGETEADEIAKRRITLADQLVRLQAPGIAADEAYRRADGLIRELDRVLRERQADELLKLWPNPLYPVNWSAALAALSKTAVAVWTETSIRVLNPGARQHLGDNMLLILPLSAFALAVWWRGRRWTDRLIGFLDGPSSIRGRRIWGFLSSLALIIVPTLGVIALAEVLRLSGLLGEVGAAIADSLGSAGLTLFTAVWLGGQVFPVLEAPGMLLTLGADRRIKGRFLASAFGLLMAVAQLRRVAMEQLDIPDAAVSVLNFPIIVICAVLLFSLGRLMRIAAQAEPATAEARGIYRKRVISIVARITITIGIIGPVLAAIGYISAASALVFPAFLTLGLAALLQLVQRLQRYLQLDRKVGNPRARRFGTGADFLCTGHRNPAGLCADLGRAGVRPDRIVDPVPRGVSTG